MQLAVGLAGNAATGRHLHHDHHPGRWFHAPTPWFFFSAPGVAGRCYRCFRCLDCAGRVAL